MGKMGYHRQPAACTHFLNEDRADDDRGARRGCGSLLGNTGAVAKGRQRRTHAATATAQGGTGAATTLAA
jgi:hypothetical protein